MTASDRTVPALALVLPGDEARQLRELARDVDLRQLLRDALGEFVDARSPSGFYVRTRYVHTQPEQTWSAFCERKEAEVERRKRAATLLQLAEPELLPVLPAQAANLYHLKLAQLASLEAVAGDDDAAREARRRIWRTIGYDVHLAFIVAASSEVVARALASAEEQAAREAPALGVVANERASDLIRAWLDPSLTTCEVIGTAEGPRARIVSASFRAG